MHFHSQHIYDIELAHSFTTGVSTIEILFGINACLQTTTVKVFRAWHIGRFSLRGNTQDFILFQFFQMPWCIAH